MLFAGALAALGFAPLGPWPLTIVALMLLLEFLARAGNLRGALVTGWVFGLGLFLVSLCWLPTAFTYQANMPAWLGWVGEVLLSAYLAVYPGLACGLAWRLGRGHRVGFVFVLAATWMLAEWLRGTLLTGFAWNPLGVIWLPLGAVSWMASWIGAYGLSSLAVLVAGVLWLGVRWRWPVTVALAVAVGAVSSWLGPARGAPEHAGIAVRIVQPNIGQDEKYAQDERNERLYATLSGKPGPVPRVLLWPEGATLRLLEIEPQARADLAALLGPRDLLLIGGESITQGAKPSDDVYHNSVSPWIIGGLFGGATTRSTWFLLGSICRHVPSSAESAFPDWCPERAISGGVWVLGLFRCRVSRAGGAAVTVGVQICYEIVSWPGH